MSKHVSKFAKSAAALVAAVALALSCSCMAFANPTVEDQGMQEFYIGFVDQSGNTLGEAWYANGDQVAVPAASHESDAQYRYDFLGWTDTETGVLYTSAQVATASGDAVYMATFSKILIKYTVTFYDFDGSVISQKTDYHYGDELVVPANPQRDGYTFTGWDVAPSSSITGNASYTAVYEALPVAASTADATAPAAGLPAGDEQVIEDDATPMASAADLQQVAKTLPIWIILAAMVVCLILFGGSILRRNNNISALEKLRK